MVNYTPGFIKNVHIRPNSNIGPDYVIVQPDRSCPYG